MSWDFVVAYKAAQREEVERMKKIPLPISGLRAKSTLSIPPSLEVNEEGQRPPKLGPMTWACNCRAPSSPRREQIFTRMYHTEVNDEGICVLCDHYAVRMEERILKQIKQHQKGRKR